MKLPLISVLQLNPSEMSTVLQSLLLMAEEGEILYPELSSRAREILARIEAKLERE